MPRAKRGNKRLQKRKDLQKLASGYRGTKSKLYRSMKESVERALKFAYVGRKIKKRDYRSLWIVRIGAAARLNGLSYSQFMHGLKVADIHLDRKLLADIAVADAKAFADLATSAKNALGKNGSAAPASPAPAAPAPAAAEEKKTNKSVAAAPASVPSGSSDLLRVSDLHEEDDKALNAIGIWLCTELLEKGATETGRHNIAKEAGLNEKNILRWVNQIDLFSRVAGVSEDLANLLEKAGVDTVVELAQRVPENLHAKLVAVNEAQNLVADVPAGEEITNWVNQAKELPRVISH